MLNRLHRFHGLGSLNFAYKKGKTVRGPLMALRFVPNDRIEQYRAAVVVSRKVHKSAVVRNRIRRRVYAIVREELAATARPHDLVFTIYSERVAEISSSELRDAVKTLIDKAAVR